MGVKVGLGWGDAGRPDATAAQPQDVDAIQDVALRLDYMVGQITPEEFRWQDANYDRDSALGRELLFLIADNQWARATSETIDIARSDTVETTIKIDVDFDRITHEAFRDRTGQLWLPVLVLPPLQQRLPEPDPFSTLTVTDPSGTPLPILPNADVRHRIAAALTEIIVNMAVSRLPDVGGPDFGATRDHRLMLSAAIYRLLRSEHVPTAVMTREVPAWQPADGPLPRFGRVRRDLGWLLKYYSGLLTSTGPSQPGDAAGAGRSAFSRQLTERAIWVLRAFAQSAVVVVAAERGPTPTVLTVAVPSRALHLAPPGWVEAGRPAGGTARRWAGPASWRWLHPANWILPRACLQIDLLLPSADADRQVQVNLPDGVSPDPSRPLKRRAELDIRTEQPLPVAQLGELMGQLTGAGEDWPPTLYQCLADLAGAKADAARESLRDHRVGATQGQPAKTAHESSSATRAFRERLDEVDAVLRDISSQSQIADHRDALSAVWRGGDWLQVPMQRRTSTDTVSPDVVVARARMIEDVSQRTAPTEARIQVHIAVTDSVYFSTARLSGWMSTLLMTVVLVFFLFEQALSISSQQVSAEVLAFVLTLFSAVQVGRLERADRSTMRGLLAPAGNPLILASILPTVVLAVALAFSRSAVWATAWAGGCIAGQQLLLWWQWLLLKLALARGLRPADGVQPQRGFLLYTDTTDYSHTEVLHSGWWRSTTADALLLGRQAYGYVVWQHGTPQTLRALLRGGRPADESQSASSPRIQVPWRPDWRRSRRLLGQQAQPAAGAPGPDLAAGHKPGAQPDHGSSPPAADADLGISPLEQPANVLALQRSGTGAQSLTFAVFRDEPKADWDCAPEDVIKVDLDPGQLAPAEDPTGVVGVFLGLGRGQGLLPIPDHPVTAVLQAAIQNRLTVLEVQLPVPAPAAAYADLQWARVQLGLRDGDVRQLAPFLGDIQRLTVPGELTGCGGGQPPPASRPPAAPPIVGVQTVSEGIPRILNPRPAAANPGPAAEQYEAGRTRLVLASDLDVVASSGVHRDESATVKTWRVMAICADWRSGVESEILASLNSELRLAGLTSAILHGKAVLLLLAHQPAQQAADQAAHQHARPGKGDDPRAAAPGRRRADGMTVYLDKWQSRKDLGAAQQYPLLRVHMRTPDRPGATLEVLESLRETLQEIAPGSLGDRDWNVWYARVVVAAGNVALIQLTARLAVDPEAVLSVAENHRGLAEFSKIERQSLALAARKMAAAGHSGGSPDPGVDAPVDTVIRVGLVNMPELDP